MEFENNTNKEYVLEKKSSDGLINIIEKILKMIFMLDFLIPLILMGIFNLLLFAFLIAVHAL